MVECRGDDPRAGDLGGLGGTLRTPHCVDCATPARSPVRPAKKGLVAGLFHWGRVPAAMADPSSLSSPHGIAHWRLVQFIASRLHH